MTQVEAIVERKARTAFPRDLDAAMALLAQCETPDRTRVQLAMLKLSGGDLEQLKLQVEVVDIDHVDAIRFAESPRIAVLWPSTLAAMAPSEKAKLMEEDRAEYEAWLNDG